MAEPIVEGKMRIPASLYKQAAKQEALTAKEEGRLKPSMNAYIIRALKNQVQRDEQRREPRERKR